MPEHPPRRWVPFSPEMNETLAKLQIAYPQITRTQLSSEALRRGMLGMLGVGTPTLLPENIVQLRRVG